MKASIQAAYRIALPLYTREVYHTFRSKTTGEQPELSIKVILSIIFSIVLVPHLHSFELFQAQRPARADFLPAGGGAFAKSYRKYSACHSFFPASAGQTPAQTERPAAPRYLPAPCRSAPSAHRWPPGRAHRTGPDNPHPCRNDLPAALGGLQKVGYLTVLRDLLRQRVKGADQRLGIVDGAVVPGEEGAVAALLLQRGQPQHRQAADPPDAPPTERPGHGAGRQAQAGRNAPQVKARQHDILPAPGSSRRSPRRQTKTPHPGQAGARCG